MDADRESPFRKDLLALFAVAGVRVAVHLATNHRYGFHRDEWQLFDQARFLDWGSVALPPVAPFLARVSMEVFGLSLTGLRLVPMLAMAAAVVLTGLMAREIGGERRAQVAAAAATAIAPLSLFQGAVFQYVSIDYLAWVAVALLTIRLARLDDPRLWPAVGLVIGLGMLTKYSIAFFVAGLVVGVVLTPLRRHLRSPWLWAGVAVSLAVFAPNAIWQWRHGFVSLEFLAAIHERDVAIGRTSGFVVGQLFVGASVFLAPLWIAGLVRALRGTDGARMRVIGWMYVTTLALFVLARGRDYYLAPAYPMLFAFGAVAFERWSACRSAGLRRATGVAAVAAYAAGAISGAALMLPIPPIGSTAWDLAAQVHDNFAEQVGWDDLVETVADVHDALPAEDRAQAGILVGNYGEAGAINLLGRRRGLPEVFSGINSYWFRGPPDPPPAVVIVVGFGREAAERVFADCREVGRVANRYGVENEESTRAPVVRVCREPRVRWSELWPTFRWFG